MDDLLPIQGDRVHQAMLDVIDRLMRVKKLSRGQELYLETLVQLVQAYEADQYPMDESAMSGVESLRRLLAEHGMNASDLGRLLGVHPSMGSKILTGTRSLTVEHVQKLSARFGVRADLFIG